MTTTLNVTVDHNGKTYEARVVTASKVSLRFDDHGFMPFIETDCATIPGLMFGKESKHLGAWLNQFVRTVGASSWEGVQGKTIILLIERGTVKGVASSDGNRVMVWEDFFKDQGVDV